MKKTLIIIGVIIIIVAVAWFVLVKKFVIPGLNIGDEPPQAAAEQSSGLGGELFNNANPFQNNLNPYKSGYTNPF